MNKHRFVWICAVMAVSLAACGGFGAQPTATLTPSAISAPTMTDTPQPTATQIPTATQMPTAKNQTGDELPLPSGEPLTEWEGFPIMPGAIAGDGDSTGYAYIIDASVEEIQAYYDEELAKLGWTLFASGEGTTKAILMMYSKNGSMFTMTIIPRPEGVMYVLMVK